MNNANTPYSKCPYSIYACFRKDDIRYEADTIRLRTGAGEIQAYLLETRHVTLPHTKVQLGHLARRIDLPSYNYESNCMQSICC